ncbi:unnamed protein product [Orchesella dallaii]|uniref:Uncharacterized protein n=1 Tax=Orchesella dallaii TaxID=48710 RepID=A0ABP1RJQ3_9HEXA
MKTLSYADLWQAEENVEWKNLLQHVCNTSERIEDSSARRLTKCTDLVRTEIDRRYISNAALSEALLLLQFSHSKYAVDVFCNTNAAGSFSTVRRTIALLGSVEFCLPQSDVVIDKATNHQFSKSIPTTLFPNDSNRNLLLARYKELNNQSTILHRGYRKAYIESTVNQAFLECKVIEGAVNDPITAEDPIAMTEDSVFTYTRVSSCKRMCRVQDMECMPENPNSFRAVAAVLDKILHYINASSPARNFIPVYMDGAPYSLCMKLLRERDVCELCEVDVDAASMDTHFKLHSSSSIPKVIYAALSRELVYPYVRNQLLKGAYPTYEGYCEWAAEMEKENRLYNIASTFCFTTLHCLHFFRCGVRNCNDEVTFHARHKLTALLYGCNNIKYQEILCYDTSFLLSVNPDNRHIVMNESARREAGEVGEGYDFLLENRNKLYKSFLPSDSAPTFEQWLQVSKTAVDLEQIRRKASERLDLNIRLSDQRPRKFAEEINQARRLIRNHGFLLKQKHGLTTIDDESIKLDQSFLNYVQHSERNRDDFYVSYFNNEIQHLPLINSGIQLEIDETNDENIKEAVQRRLNMLREPFYSFYKKSYKRTMTKPEHLEFHKALVAQLQNQEHTDYESVLSEAFQDYMDLHSCT